MTEISKTDSEWEPKIIGFLCNWCSSTFFFGQFPALAEPHKEKRRTNKEIRFNLLGNCKGVF